MAVFINSLPTQIITNGLLLYLDARNPKSYPGIGNTWFDISGNSANATIVNSPTYSKLDGGYFIMNGINNYIALSTSVLGTNTTQTIWYKWNGVNQLAVLSFLGDTGAYGYGMLMNDGSNSGTAGNRIVGLIPFNSYNGGGVTSPLSSTSWTQITMIRNVSIPSMQFYINGVFNAGGNIFANGADTVLPFSLGRSSGEPFAAGNLGAAMLYNRALSASEVLQNYNAQKSRFGL